MTEELNWASEKGLRYLTPLIRSTHPIYLQTKGWTQYKDMQDDQKFLASTVIIRHVDLTAHKQQSDYGSGVNYGTRRRSWALSPIPTFLPSFLRPLPNLGDPFRVDSVPCTWTFFDFSHTRHWGSQLSSWPELIFLKACKLILCVNVGRWLSAQPNNGLLISENWNDAFPLIEHSKENWRFFGIFLPQQKKNFLSSNSLDGFYFIRRSIGHRPVSYK
jgi:hypothetical protein